MGGKGKQEKANAISKFVSQPKNYNELKARKNVSTFVVFDFFIFTLAGLVVYGHRHE